MVRKIIAFAGYEGSGKSFRCQQLVKQGNYTKMSFADALRRVAFKSLGFPVEEGMKQYDWFKLNPCVTLTTQDGASHSITFRKFLEYLGTEGIRTYSKDFWAHCLLHDIELLPNEMNVCIDDLRFHNEYKYLKQFADEHGYEFEFIFCDYHSDRYIEHNLHASARLASFLKEVGYEDGDTIKEDDMQHYINALDEVCAV